MGILRRLPAIVPIWVGLMPGVLLGQAQGDVAGKMISVQGTVEVDISGWTPGEVDQLLNAGNIVRTAIRSRATVLLLDETQLKIAPSSQLQLAQVRKSSFLLSRLASISSSVDQSILNLNRGKVWLRARKRPTTMQVQTPAVTAAIRGTEFVIEVRDDGESIATVLEGSVELSNPQGSITVNTGEEGRALVGQAPTKRVIVNPQDAVQWTLYYTASVSPRDYPFVTASQANARSQLASPPINPVALAQLQHDAGDLDAALVTLQGVTGTNAAEARGWILLQLSRIGEAVAELEALASPSWRGKVALSIAHWRAGDLQTAYMMVENETDPQSQILKATYLVQAGEIEAARQILEGVSPTDATRSQALGLLAVVQLVQNDKAAALASAQSAVQSNPDSPSAHLNLSLVQQSFFDLPAATHSARAALERDPNFVSAQVQLAKLLFGAGKTGAAKEIAQTTLQMAPEDADVQSLMGFIQLAQARAEPAVQRFQRSIRLDSGAAEPRLGLGIALMRQGKYDEAITEILSAAALEPRVAHYQSYLGKAFYEKRDFEQAFTALASAMELDPRDPTPHLYSGIFENDLNRPAAAVQSLQTSMRLNDNRAVYRSRFVLDQDQSTRNVQLASSFNRLGLTNWANVEGVFSNLSDPTNSSAHLLLAGTFLNLPGRTGAAGSELLYTRLLLPVNANSFNSFNDYTTLYESSRLNFTTAGTYGSFDARSGTIIASGGGKRWGFGVNFTYDRDQGFRELNNDTKNYTGFSLMKYALGPNTDVLLSLSLQQSNSGDRGGTQVQDSSSPIRPFPEDPDLLFDRPFEGYDQFRFPTGERADSFGIVPYLGTTDGRDPNLRLTSRLDRFEAGFHHRFRPGSDAVVLFSAQLRRQVVDRFVQILNLRGQRVARQIKKLRTSLRLPSLSIQAAHLLKFDRYRIKYGVDVLKGRARERIQDTTWDDCTGTADFGNVEAEEIIEFCVNTVQRFTDGGTNGPGFFESSLNRPAGGALLDSLVYERKDVSSGTAFLQADVEIGPFTVNGGLNYDWSSDDNIFVGPDTMPVLFSNERDTDESITQWNPQGGVFFRPNESTIVRFTAARTLQPLTSGIKGGAFTRERLVPAHLNGFLLFQNEIELTRSDLYEAALDYRWDSRTFFQIDGFLRKKRTPVGDFFQIISFPPAPITRTTRFTFEGDTFGGRAMVSRLFGEQFSVMAQYVLTDDDVASSSRRNEQGNSPPVTRRSHDSALSFFWVSPSGFSARVTETYFKQNAMLGGRPANSKVYLTDVSFRYELPRKFGLITFSGENLFDRRFRYIVDPLALRFRTPERKWEVGLQFFF